MRSGPSFVGLLLLVGGFGRLVSGALPPWSRMLAAFGVALAVPLLLMGRWIWQMLGSIEDAAHGELAPMIDVRDVGPSGASISLALVVAAVVAVALSRSPRDSHPRR